MTSQLQDESYNALLQMMEYVTESRELAQELKDMPFEEVTPENWRVIQEGMELFEAMFQLFEMCIKAGGDVVADEALLTRAHEVVNIPQP